MLDDLDGIAGQDRQSMQSAVDQATRVVTPVHVRRSQLE